MKWTHVSWDQRPTLGPWQFLQFNCQICILHMADHEPPEKRHLKGSKHQQDISGWCSRWTFPFVESNEKFSTGKLTMIPGEGGLLLTSNPKSKFSMRNSIMGEEVVTMICKTPRSAFHQCLRCFLTSIYGANVWWFTISMPYFGIGGS